MDYEFLEFNKDEIKPPFEVIPNVNVIKGCTFGLDLYLFLSKLSYLPNVSHSIKEKDDKIKNINISVSLGFPSLKEGILAVKNVVLRFKVVRKDLLETFGYKYNRDLNLINQFTRFMVLPQKFSVVDFNSFDWKEKEKEDVIKYIKNILFSFDKLPFFLEEKTEEAYTVSLKLNTDLICK
jgi:hypothetical protein